MTGADGAGAVRQYIEVMNRLDIDALAYLFTTDVVVRLPYAPDPIPRVTEGRENVLALYAGFPSLVSPLGFHDVEVSALAEPGDFLAEYRSDCTMLATGEPYRNRYISRFSIRDGQIAAFTEYFDPLVFLRAQGATIAEAR